jgi:hypothetical protein
MSSSRGSRRRTRDASGPFWGAKIRLIDPDDAHVAAMGEKARFDRRESETVRSSGHLRDSGVEIDSQRAKLAPSIARSPGDGRIPVVGLQLFRHLNVGDEVDRATVLCVRLLALIFIARCPCIRAHEVVCGIAQASSLRGSRRRRNEISPRWWMRSWRTASRRRDESRRDASHHKRRSEYEDQQSDAIDTAGHGTDDQCGVGPNRSLQVWIQVWTEVWIRSPHPEGRPPPPALGFRRSPETDYPPPT